MNVHDFDAGEQARRGRALAAHLADPEHGHYPPIASPGFADLAGLPDEPPLHHPRPWSFEGAGNGKGWIVDSDGGYVLPMCLWDAGDAGHLQRELTRINGTPSKGQP